MKIIYHEGPLRLETQGQGDIKQGVARDIDDEYGFSLCIQGIVEPADDEAREIYERMQVERGMKPPEPKKAPKTKEK